MNDKMTSVECKVPGLCYLDRTRLAKEIKGARWVGRMNKENEGCQELCGRGLEALYLHFTLEKLNLTFKVIMSS